MVQPNTIVTTKRDLIKKLSEDFDGKYTEGEISDILRSLEFYAVDSLMLADEEHPAQVRLFGGLQLNCKFKPETTRNTVFGTAEIIPAHFEVRAKFTRYFNQKFNEIAETHYDIFRKRAEQTRKNKRKPRKKHSILNNTNMRGTDDYGKRK